MANYVYILQSYKSKRYYCGQTNSIEQRLQRHNEGKVKSTKSECPWQLTGYVQLASRSECMQLEKKIKGRGIERWLVENYKLLTH